MKFQVNIEAALMLLQKQGIEIQIANSSPETIATANQVLAKKLTKWIGVEQEATNQCTHDEEVSAYIIFHLNDAELIANHPTFWVYAQYVRLCKFCNISPQFNKLHFSKVIARTFHYWIQNVKKDGKKYRVFRRTVQDRGKLSPR